MNEARKLSKPDPGRDFISGFLGFSFVGNLDQRLAHLQMKVMDQERQFADAMAPEALKDVLWLRRFVRDVRLRLLAGFVSTWVDRGVANSRAIERILTRLEQAPAVHADKKKMLKKQAECLFKSNQEILENYRLGMETEIERQAISSLLNLTGERLRTLDGQHRKILQEIQEMKSRPEVSFYEVVGLVAKMRQLGLLEMK